MNKLFVKNSILRAMYFCSGRRPWSRGYQQEKFHFIDKVLHDASLMETFKGGSPLPRGYGQAFDERVIEYPWLFSRLNDHSERFLDAGSVLNFKELVEHPSLQKKDLFIYTLAPEYQAFWDKKISYIYGDLRDIPFKDECFDSICSISTLGHVGMDNRIYTKNGDSHSNVILEAHAATQELLRVLAKKGHLYISVVFGKRQLIAWDGTPFAEQFDAALLSDFLTVFDTCASVKTQFYKYTVAGWNVAQQEECAECEYYNIHVEKQYADDRAAAARAVALIEVVK